MNIATNGTQINEEFAQYANSRVAMSIPADAPFCSMDQKTRQVVYNMHAGQRDVMRSKMRIIAAIAGRQGGKSAVGAPWLHEEIKKKGPGIYMVVAPSYPLLVDSAIPKIEELFQTYFQYGQIRTNPLRFVFSSSGEKRIFAGTPWESVKSPNPTTIRFGHAANPESLEAKTAKAAWLDEAGQNGFKQQSWEAIRGRVTTTGGRILITTTPYNLGWLKTKVIDPWKESKEKGENHKLIDVIAWKSIENPGFPMDEYYMLKESLPFWKWDMFYNGNFTVPAGLIYGVMIENEAELRIKRSEIPMNGPRYGGLDFGGPNTCGVMASKDPVTGDAFLYRTYFPGVTLPIAQHVRNILKSERYFDRFVGGAKGEVVFREEFQQNGLRIDEPEISDVQAGIDRLYGLIAQKRFYVCDDLDDWWSELYTYQYETDPDTGDVKPELKIKGKSGFHHMDATRYLASIFGLQSSETFSIAGGERASITSLRSRSSVAIGLQDKPTNRGNIVMPDTGMKVSRSSVGLKAIRGFSGVPRRPGQIRRHIGLMDDSD